MGTPDERFDELRSLLEGDRPFTAASLLTLLKQAHQEDPSAYERRSLPYLEQADLPRFSADSCERLAALAPVVPEHARIDAFLDDDVEHEAIVEMLASPLAQRLTSLSVVGMAPQRERQEELFAQPGLAAIPALRFGSFDDWVDHAVELLATTPLPRLGSLSFSYAGELTDAHCERLAGAPHLRGLEALRFEPSEWEEPPMHQLSDAGIAAILEAFPQLVHLHLGGAVSVTEATAERVATLPGLRVLGMSAGVPKGSARGEWLAALAPRLTHLDLSDSGTPVSALPSEPLSLIYLKLARNELDGSSVAELEGSTAFGRLRHLSFVDLADWHVSDQYGVDALRCTIGAEDVEVLLRSPRFPALEHVDHLDLDGYPEATRRRPGGDWEPMVELGSEHEPRWPLTD